MSPRFAMMKSFFEIRSFSLWMIAALILSTCALAGESESDLTRNVPLSEVLQINEDVASLLGRPEACTVRPTGGGRDVSRSVTGGLCRSRANYMQTWHHDTMATSIAPLTTELQSCVSKALQNPHHATEPRMYGECAGKKGTPVRGVGYACPSSELVSYMAETLRVATTCLGLDPKELLPTFARESRMHPNVVSPAGAWGAGQLMNDTITNMNVKLAARDKTPESFPLQLRGDPECGAVRQMIENPEARLNHGRTQGSGSVCERIQGPDGPLKNLVYASLVYLGNKSAAAAVIYRWKNLTPALPATPPLLATLALPWVTIAEPQAEEKALADRMAGDVALYMYNGGSDSRLNLLKKFVSSQDPKMKLETFRREFQASIGKAYGLKENYHYLEATRITASQLGPNCGQPGFGIDVQAYKKAHPRTHVQEL
ncbi:MAG: hypothetical protein H7222_17570 [Methylotenera sp.]|nr:hypothetical protein [Oligoflexia bacterium]